MRSSIKAEEVEVGAQIETEVETETEAEAKVKEEVKVLVAAKAEVDTTIVTTKERQNEVTHHRIRSARRNPKAVVQVNRERRRNDDDGPEVKILPHKHQNNCSSVSINTKCDFY